MTDDNVLLSSPFAEGPQYDYLLASDNLPVDLPDDDGEALCKIHLFDPIGPGEWWLATFNPAPRYQVVPGCTAGVCYGVAQFLERECSAGMLLSNRGIWGFRSDEGPIDRPIERDLDYTPRTINELLVEWFW